MDLRGRGDAVSSAVVTLRRTVRTGQGAIIWVTGEPGVGKSSVLSAVAEQAQRLGYVVGVGKAEEVDQIAPGAPLLVALRSGPQPLLDSEAFTGLATLYSQPLWLVDRVAALLEELASRQPVVIAVDDVQWADAISRFALRILPGRLAGSPVVWLLASREHTGPHSVEISSDLRDGVPLNRLSLSPLSEDDIMVIAARRLGQAPTGRARELLREVGGNPLLAAQLLEGLVAARAAGDFEDDIPDGLRQMVRARCRALAPASVALVKMCSVLGRPFQADELLELLGDDAEDLDPDWLPTLVTSGLMVDRGHHVAFRHDLIRHAVYADLSVAARRTLHRRCANWLLTSDGRALAAAPHALAAAVPGDEFAIDILTAAAEQSAEANPDGAADLAQHAYGLTATDHLQWARRGQRAVELLTAAQRDSDAVRLADEVLRRVSDPETSARLQFLASRSLWRMGRVVDIEERVTGWDRTSISEQIAGRLTATRALTLTRTETAEVARRGAELALAEGRRSGDAITRLVALEALGEVARNEGRHADARQHFHELGVSVGDDYLALEIGALQLLDRYAEAAELLDRARREAAARAVAVAPSLLGAQLWQDFNLGRFDDAEAGARTLVRLADELGNHVSAHDAQLILVALSLMRGHLHAAREQLRQVEHHHATDEYVSAPGLELMRGWLSASEGDLTQSMVILRPLLQSALDSRSYWPWWPGWMRLFTELGVAAGDADFARQAARIAQVGAERNPGVRSFEGQALHLRGLLEKDLGLLGDAVRVLDGGPRKMLLAPALTDLGTALLADGQRKAGVAALDRSWHLYEEVGDTVGMAPVQRALQKAGARRKYWPTARSQAVSGWESLTLGEVRVAQLIGSGHSNRTAAAALNLSPNTIATHLRSIFAKLSVSSRVQLALALAEVPEDQRSVSRRTSLDDPIDVSRIASDVSLVPAPLNDPAADPGVGSPPGHDHQR